MKVGFIGLGIMGSRMAANLQKAGHELVVHNRTRSKANALVTAGARWADSPAALAEEVPLLITMLAHPQAVQEMAGGETGFLDHLQAGSLWVEASTVNPSFSRQMAAEARSRQIRFVDAPVAGSKGAADEAKLLFLVGGHDEDVAECRPLFEVMGSTIKHVGGPGMGTSLKMVFNLLLAESMLIFSEAMALGQSLGFSQEMLLDTLVGAAVTAPFLAGKRSKIESGDYTADFPLQWMHKDIHLGALTAYENGVPLPAGNLTKEIYAMARQQGLGDQDFSAIYRFLVRNTG